MPQVHIVEENASFKYTFDGELNDLGRPIGPCKESLALNKLKHPFSFNGVYSENSVPLSGRFTGFIGKELSFINSNLEKLTINLMLLCGQIEDSKPKGINRYLIIGSTGQEQIIEAEIKEGGLNLIETRFEAGQHGEAVIMQILSENRELRFFPDKLTEEAVIAKRLKAVKAQETDDENSDNEAEATTTSSSGNKRKTLKM
jgi:hypothetical protein